jgi:hypothetical protein
MQEFDFEVQCGSFFSACPAKPSLYYYGVFIMPLSTLPTILHVNRFGLELKKHA